MSYHLIYVPWVYQFAKLVDPNPAFSYLGSGSGFCEGPATDKHVAGIDFFSYLLTNFIYINILNV